VKRVPRSKPQWQHLRYRLFLEPIGLLFGLITLILVVEFLTTSNSWFLLLLIFAAVAFAGPTLWAIRRLPKAWRGSWQLEILFEAEHAVQRSERLWQVVLEGLTSNGFPWERVSTADHEKAFPRAHDPIEFSSERIRLWFDNSPSVANTDPSIVRAVFILEPRQGARDAPTLRQTIIESLLAEENRQRAERLATARKA